MIICFSRIVDHNVLQKYSSRVPIAGADDNFNRRIIEGIEENGEKPILINFMPYQSYPVGKFFIYKKEETNIEGRKIINIGYINIPIIKSLILKKNIIYEAKKLINRKENINILIYDSYSAFLDAAIKLKKWNSNIKSTLIVPSIPSFDVPRKDFKAQISKCFSKKLLEKAKQMDSYVFLTKQMNNILNKERKPYTVIEGIIPNIIHEKYAELDKRLINKKYVLYSGRLDKIYSIDKLVNCFEKRKDDIYLVLCGIGDYVEEIKKKSKDNKKIIYLGFKNRPELNTIQQNALILINPRSPEGIYTRYSFPSKTMEYLLTGKPVVMHKLPGIPDEYDKYLYYIKLDSERSINDAISTVLKDIKDGKAESKSKAGRYFVLHEKNIKKQATKIMQLFKKI